MVVLHMVSGPGRLTRLCSHGGSRWVRAASVFAHVAIRPDKARPLLPIISKFPAILTLGVPLSGKTRQVVARPLHRVAFE